MRKTKIKIVITADLYRHFNTILKARREHLKMVENLLSIPIYWVYTSWYKYIHFLIPEVLTLKIKVKTPNTIFSITETVQKKMAFEDNFTVCSVSLIFIGGMKVLNTFSYSKPSTKSWVMGPAFPILCTQCDINFHFI